MLSLHFVFDARCLATVVLWRLLATHNAYCLRQARQTQTNQMKNHRLYMERVERALGKKKQKKTKKKTAVPASAKELFNLIHQQRVPTQSLFYFSSNAWVCARVRINGIVHCSSTQREDWNGSSIGAHSEPCIVIFHSFHFFLLLLWPLTLLRLFVWVRRCALPVWRAPYVCQTWNRRRSILVRGIYDCRSAHRVPANFAESNI